MSKIEYSLINLVALVLISIGSVMLFGWPKTVLLDGSIMLGVNVLQLIVVNRR